MRCAVLQTVTVHADKAVIKAAVTSVIKEVADKKQQAAADVLDLLKNITDAHSFKDVPDFKKGSCDGAWHFMFQLCSCSLKRWLPGLAGLRV
jgi:hypothetical protein